MKDLLNLYEKKKSEIKKRLSEFQNADIFKELAFCLCTPQSKALNCWAAVEELFDSKKFHGSEEEIESVLNKNKVRFPKNKAKYIVLARERALEMEIKNKLNNENISEAREFLVKNIKGFGYKEASHFLRNIGLGKGLAILDRHILRNLKGLGIIEELPKTLSKNKYLEIEDKMKQFCNKIGIPMEEMDLLLWAKETGFVFK